MDENRARRQHTREAARICGAAVFILAALPATASADVILGPGVDGGYMAVIGSAIVGVIEGVIGRVFFKAPLGRAIRRMILGNYASAFLGLALSAALARGVSLFFTGPEIFWLPKFVWAVFAASYFATLVLEFPFCWWTLGGGKSTLRRAIVFCFAAQSATYALLAPYYYASSSMSLYEKATIVKITSFTKNPSAVVYYIDAKGKNLCKMRLDGTAMQVVKAFVGRSDFDRLNIQKDVNGNWQLWAEEWRGEGEALVLDRFPAEEDAILRSANFVGRDGRTSITRYRQGNQGCIDSRPEGERDVRVEPMDLLDKTLVITDDMGRWARGHIGLTFEVPTKTLSWGMVNMLAGDEAVVDVDNQVVLLDARTGKIGFLVEGRGPFVVPQGT